LGKRRDAPEGPSPPAAQVNEGRDEMGGWEARRERKLMNNGLVDEDTNFILPLLVVGVIAVVVLLIAGLFIRSSVSTW
jgi:hypothetical protein